MSSINMGTRQILTKSIGNVESMILKMKNPDMLLIVIYRPTGVQLVVFTGVMQEIKSIIESYENSKTSIIITGIICHALIGRQKAYMVALETYKNKHKCC